MKKRLTIKIKYKKLYTFIRYIKRPTNNNKAQNKSYRKTQIL